MQTTSFKRRSKWSWVIPFMIFLVSSQQLLYTIAEPPRNIYWQQDWQRDWQRDWQKVEGPKITDKIINESSFSACLLVMDDNHYLIEWLAFHYHVLPLRYLVIAVDPRSKTTPDLVLDRWKELMVIVRWTDSNFLPKEWLSRNVVEGDAKAKFILHRERQRHFYPSCFQHLKRANRTWTTVVDIDEFVVANRHFSNITKLQKQRVLSSSLLEGIHQMPEYKNSACITMPRVRFGNYLEPNIVKKTFSPAGFHDMDFLTLRWRWRASLDSKKDNRNPKSMIDVSKIEEASFSRLNTDAHRPVRSHCPRGDLYKRNADSPFCVHHYVGTKEQWDFRRDAREGMKQRSGSRFLEYSELKSGFDESACGWMKDFHHKFGLAGTQRLLEGVGNTTYN